MLTLLIIANLICECTKCEADPIPTPTPPNFCSEPQQFKGGTLWKPKGDHTGNLVVLLKESYPDFDYCEVKRKDLTWEKLVYTGRSNGNRQTYRGSMPGGHYAGKRKSGGVRCFLNSGKCEWPIPGNPANRWE